MQRVAVVGSRSFDDYEHLKQVMGGIYAHYKDIQIISGGARGTDTLAERYASEFSIDAVIYLPDYKKYGKSAAFLRNTDIVKNSDIVVAFWDGKSAGTRDSIEKAKRLGKILKIYYFDHAQEEKEGT